MKIAILEDDKSLRHHLAQILVRQGWQCLEIESIDQLLTLTRMPEEIELFILDRMIGQDDSVNYLQKIKSAYPAARILILSSLDLPEEKAKWLTGGADEYMGKPVFGDELVARVLILTKRKGHEPAAFLKIGDLTIDKFKHQITGTAGRLDLTAKEYGLLLLLAEHPGRIYNRVQILENLWDMDSNIETNVVESTINHLRRKLESSESKVTIKSKRNIGYWIET